MRAPLIQKNPMAPFCTFSIWLPGTGLIILRSVCDPAYRDGHTGLRHLCSEERVDDRSWVKVTVMARAAFAKQVVPPLG